MATPACYLADLVGRVGVARIEQAATILETVPALPAKIADARASAWRKYPSLYLADIASSEKSVDAVLETIRILSTITD